MTRVVLVVGAGGVLGSALLNEFASAGDEVMGLRRSDVDLANGAAVQERVAAIAAERGRIDVLVCNAARLLISPFQETSLVEAHALWQVNVGSALGAVQAALPGMLARGQGTMIFTGATASLRGSARFSAFAATKFALRGLAQSLAREVQAQGVHVAHVVLDGLLRGSSSAERFGRPGGPTLDPVEVARSYRWLADQPTTAWVHEIDLRPAGEKF